MSTVPARLSVVTLGVRDLTTMRRFYSSLGWRLAPYSSEDYAAFLLGGVVLALYPLPLLAEEAAPGEPEPGGGWTGVTLACAVDRREQVDEVFAAWVAAGATPIASPVDRSWGGRSGFVADPEGNRWEIAWVPRAAFDERGAVVAYG